MNARGNEPEALCVGAAAYDMIFAVDSHLIADEKKDASDLVRCGGGPAANASVTICSLGHSAAFAGYLGQDPFGEENLRELVEAGVLIDLVLRGPASTPLSAVMVKPDGRRALVSYRDPDGHLGPDAINLEKIEPGIILFDGHEPLISTTLARAARRRGIPIILDAGSVRPGTVELSSRCDHLACALKFALGFTGASNEKEALERLSGLAPTVIITLGNRGLIWSMGQARGRQPAFAVEAVDTTGAGDVFHGAYAVALLEEMAWEETLRFASAAAALCCTALGARPGIPTRREVEEFLSGDPPLSAVPAIPGDG